MTPAASYYLPGLAISYPSCLRHTCRSVPNAAACCRLVCLTDMGGYSIDLSASFFFFSQRLQPHTSYNRITALRTRACAHSSAQSTTEHHSSAISSSDGGRRGLALNLRDLCSFLPTPPVLDSPSPPDPLLLLSPHLFVVNSSSCMLLSPAGIFMTLSPFHTAGDSVLPFFLLGDTAFGGLLACGYRACSPAGSAVTFSCPASVS